MLKIATVGLAISQDFSWFQDILQISHFSVKEREVATKEKKEVACIVSKPLLSLFVGNVESL